MRLWQIFLVLTIVAAGLSASMEPAAAQLFRRKPTCTSLHKRCLSLSSGYGRGEAQACAQQRDACMKSGEWKSRAFEYKSVDKR